MGPGGAAAELHVEENRDLERAHPGAGGVHHVAFRTPDKAELDEWVKRVTEFGVRSSGEVERYYFTSLYFREPNGILFEIATDGPGFAVDEPLETLGENLALPPFLEGKRAQHRGGVEAAGDGVAVGILSRATGEGDLRSWWRGRPRSSGRPLHRYGDPLPAMLAGEDRRLQRVERGRVGRTRAALV